MTKDNVNRTDRWVLGLIAMLLGAGVVVAIVLLPQATEPPLGDDASVDRSGGGGAVAHSPHSRPAGYTGSAVCGECHKRFHELWATSHHGLAMQPYTAEFARKELVGPADAVTVGKRRWRVVIDETGGWVVSSGADASRFRIVHALGGKNIYYFLTPMQRGRLQVLPLAYDVRKDEWFDTAGSMVRHFLDRGDQAVDWRDATLTFNTSCFGCHVSQLSTNYDLATDTYSTTWGEPGINCETCHGGAAEHVRVCRAAKGGPPPTDLKTFIHSKATVAQRNASCAPCHAKMRPLTDSFSPGERYFDHFDLITWEDSDFAPDGRDLGENYTYTSWRTSPCAASGKLDCSHCHTSSGRNRFAGAKANDACLPCHAERVAAVVPHSRHVAGKPGGRCVDCHMAKSTFARMVRHDHSMRPPTPAVTVRFGSPNACNLCHADKDAAWADKHVRKWHPSNDYQAPVLGRAGLIAAARKGDFARLGEMLALISAADRDEILATSLIRLLVPCRDERRLPVLREALRDASPLVRSSAIRALATDGSRETGMALLAATGDASRLVRVAAASALSPYPAEAIPLEHRKAISAALDELQNTYRCRPDQWHSHYNMGNFHEQRGNPAEALKSFAIAARLRPDIVVPLVNAATTHLGQGAADDAEAMLRKALAIDPASPEVLYSLAVVKVRQKDLTAAEKHFRAAIQADPKFAGAMLELGLLKAGQGKVAAAEEHLLAALDADPNFAPAAFNLGVILASDRLAEGIAFCRKAHQLRPGDGKYAYTLAFYLREAGQSAEAIVVLAATVKRDSAGADVYYLLGEIYTQQNDKANAAAVYRLGRDNERLSPRDRVQFRGLLLRLR